MRIQLITPEKFQWLDGYAKAFSEVGSVEVLEKPNPKTQTDTYVFMWCNADTVNFINGYKDLSKKFVVFIRRYELFSQFISKLDWSKVASVIMVNDHLADIFEKQTGVKPTVIYNGVDVDRWGFRERTHGNKIAMVGYVLPKKGQAMGLDILRALNGYAPGMQYELHIAGSVQDMAYLDFLNFRIKKHNLNVSFHGRVNNIDDWLEGKNYILSCAFSEGCPNNIIEAMAKGIKPVVYDWPGASRQFGDYTFDNIDDAVKIITKTDYNSQEYREVVEKDFSAKQYEKVARIIKGEKC